MVYLKVQKVDLSHARQSPWQEQEVLLMQKRRPLEIYLDTLALSQKRLINVSTANPFSALFTQPAFLSTPWVLNLPAIRLNRTTAKDNGLQMKGLTEISEMNE